MSDLRPVLGLIPARGGSRGIPGKNLVPLAGRPLIAHTIAAAREAEGLDRVIVSTDDATIAAEARAHGAEAPFLRPADLAGDTAPALAVMRHALAWLEAEEGWLPRAVVYLQPTSPLRRPEHIEDALAILARGEVETVVSVVPVPHAMNPLSVMTLEGGRLEPFLAQGAGVLRRQDKPQVWARNGPAVLALTREAILTREALYAGPTAPLIMTPEDSVDIDTPWDLELAQWLLSRRGEAAR